MPTMPIPQDVAKDNALKVVTEFKLLKELLGLSFQIRDQYFNNLSGQFKSVDELFHNPEFLSRLNQSVYLSDATGTIWIKLVIKNGRIVSFSIVLSMKIQWSFLYKQGRTAHDILYVGYTAGPGCKNVAAAIPLSDFRPERITKYFPNTVGETTHDSKEIGRIICYMLSHYINKPDPKSTHYLGDKQGFEKNDQHNIQFNPSVLIPGALHRYLSPSILSRQSPSIGGPVSEDISPTLHPLFSGKKQFQVALLFRIASWMQFLFALCNVYADNVLLVKTTELISVLLLVSLFKNTAYDALNAPPIGPKVKPMKFALENINDGVALVIDTFAADQLTKGEKGYDLLIQDVSGATCSGSVVHHVPVLITQFADLYIPREKRCILEMDDTVTAYSPSDYKAALKRLDAALIYRIERGCNKGDLIETFRRHVDEVKANIPADIPPSKWMTYIMLMTALEIYGEFFSPLFDEDLRAYIIEWLISQGQEQQPLNERICSEFGKILNKKSQTATTNSSTRRRSHRLTKERIRLS